MWLLTILLWVPIVFAGLYGCLYVLAKAVPWLEKYAEMLKEKQSKWRLNMEAELSKRHARSRPNTVKYNNHRNPH